VFRLRRPQQASDAAFYKDPGAFMDLLLKGMKLPRIVGNEAIRITSLGHAPQLRTFEDKQGRRWQISTWPLGYTDSYVVCYALPTPEGYVGMAGLAPSPELAVMDTYLSELTENLYVSYSGTLSQWTAFLSHPELRPRSFDKFAVTFDDAQVGVRSARVTLQVPRDLAGFSAASELTVDMTYILENGKLSWDIGALYLYKDLDEHTYAGLRRQAKPTDETAHEQLDIWEQMRTHGPGFNRVAGHDSDFKNYWIHDSLSAPLAAGPGLDPAATVLYDVFYSTTASAYPQDLEDAERRLIHGTHILER